MSPGWQVVDASFPVADFTAKWPPTSEEERQGAGIVSESATTQQLFGFRKTEGYQTGRLG
jgi:hypothetical protein